MSFKRSPEEIKKKLEGSGTADFPGAEMVEVIWLTKPEIIKRILPPPLKPAKLPLAHAFVSNYPETNFGLPYLESALFVRCEHDGIEGNYCLAMHLDGPGKDLAMAGGRENFGFPKKLANISFNLEKRNFKGTSERHGVVNIDIATKLNGRMNDRRTPELLLGTDFISTGQTEEKGVTVNYNIKHYPAVNGTGFEYKPILTKQETVFKPERMRFGIAELTLGSSPHDPWAEVEVDTLLTAIYIKGYNTMLRGSVVAELDPIEFAPYSYLKWDWW
ncbi:MAG: acetoacetate decarboxylase family protein [Candidatus Hodarchaeota archaeon]